MAKDNPDMSLEMAAWLADADAEIASHEEAAAEGYAVQFSSPSYTDDDTVWYPHGSVWKRAPGWVHAALRRVGYGGRS
jgi:hypothetical protein